MSDNPLCRTCAVALTTTAERLLGIHIRCVYEASQTTVRVPRPRYRGDDDDGG